RPALLGASPRTRVILPVGFVAIATAAFLHGSLLVSNTADPTVSGLRLGGIVLVVISTFRWDADATFRQVLWAGLFLLVVAEVLSLSHHDMAGSWVRAGGTLGVGVVLFTSSRRSIPARVVTSAAATLLLVVLAISVALSAVIARNVRDEAVRRVQARAGTERDQVDAMTQLAIRSANIIAQAEGSPQGHAALVTQLAD